MEKQNDALWEFDRAFGVPLCGVDEAGRGPLAGPVFAACAVLKPGAEIPWLNDSKKLTEKRREAIFRDILENGKAWFGIGTASPAEMFSTDAPSFCACLTLEFMNTVQRLPRSTG